MALYYALKQEQALTRELQILLQELTFQLPKRTQDREISKQWWQINGLDWIKKFRILMNQHRSIGYDWQFGDKQKESLQQYYVSHKILIYWLNSDCPVSDELKNEIENTLFLPIAEIEKRKRKR